MASLDHITELINIISLNSKGTQKELSLRLNQFTLCYFLSYFNLDALLELVLWEYSVISSRSFSCKSEILSVALISLYCELIHSLSPIEGEAFYVPEIRDKWKNSSQSIGNTER